MKKAIIFDMDGVLVDTEPLHFAVEKELFHEAGIAVSEEKHQSFVGSTTAEMWRQLGREHELLASIPDLVECMRTGTRGTQRVIHQVRKHPPE